jgi:hypothetical protein
MYLRVWVEGGTISFRWSACMLFISMLPRRGGSIKRECSIVVHRTNQAISHHSLTEKSSNTSWHSIMWLPHREEVGLDRDVVLRAIILLLLWHRGCWGRLYGYVNLGIVGWATSIVQRGGHGGQGWWEAPVQGRAVGHGGSIGSPHPRVAPSLRRWREEVVETATCVQPPHLESLVVVPWAATRRWSWAC